MPVMSEQWQIENQANKKRWFKGNNLAISFINQLFYCVELWDDLIDKDVEITDERINECFTIMFVGFAANDWFVNNRSHYLPLMIMAINGFRDANKLTKSPEDKLRNVAFHIRNLGIEIHIATAFLIGGLEYMNEVSEEIRRFFAFESYKEWEHG